MLPWQRAAPNPPPPEDLEDDESEDEVDDSPPPQFTKDARAILPTASQRTIYSAWDRSRGIGAGGDKAATAYDSGSARVQAALGFLFDDPLPAPSDRRGASPAVASPATPPEPLFRPESVSPEPEKREVVVIDSDDDAPPRKLLNKGKGKARAESSPPPQAPSSDGIEIVESPKKKKRRVPFVTINDDGSDDVDMAAAPPPHRHRPPPPPPVRRPRSPTPPDPNLSPEDVALASILAIIPDVLPSHVLTLLRSENFGGNPDRVVESLFSGEYPKSEDLKGKGKKRARDDEVEATVAKDWLQPTWRTVPSVEYKSAAITQLYNDFDFVAATYIKNALKKHHFFYAPAYVALRAEVKNGEVEMIAKRRVEKKAKDGEPDIACAELETEKNWLRERLLKEKADKKKEKTEKQKFEADREGGLLIECGCCFGECSFDMMVSCTEGDLFCKECAVNNANTQIGLRHYTMPCMSTDGCSAEFSMEEAKRFLPESSIFALQKVRQEKEIDEAEIDGLSKCPFCPFAAVIENPDEKLFHCAREGCEIISCRRCKKLEHLPFSCAEWEEKNDRDRKIDSIHKVEEAMTQALIRYCPKCKEPYVKSDGCNKITCSNCHAHSCYVCGKLTGTQYNHWSPIGSRGEGCPQFDDTEMRNFNEVEEARKAAAAKVAAENPAIDSADIDPLKMVQPDRRAAAPPPHGANVNHGFLPGNFDHNGYFEQLLAAMGGGGGGWGAGFQGFGGGGLGGFGGGGAAVAGPGPRARAARLPPAAAAPARGHALGGGHGPRFQAAQPPTPAELRARAALAAERRVRGG